MFKKLTNTVTNYLANFIELQLVITLMSLPILISWGLPISYMSLISNLVFTPLLILFLWVSCIFAVCALLHIPCSFFAKMLDHITNIWMWMLSFSKPSWILGFSYQTIWMAIIICLCIITLYTYKKPTNKQAVCILFFLCSCMLLLRWCMTKNMYKKVGNLPMIALRANNKNYIVDYGALCAKQNFYSNIDYTIIPELIKQTGITNIDTLVLCKPSKRLAKVALQFAKQMNVKTIIATTKDNCFKTLELAYKNSDITILPLIKKNKKVVPYLTPINRLNAALSTSANIFSNDSCQRALNLSFSIAEARAHCCAKSINISL